MKSGSDLRTPEFITTVWRGAALLMLGLAWMIGESGVEGFLVLFLLGIVTLARWRFSLPGWTVLADQAVCAIGLAYWSGAWFGLALPFFEIARTGRAAYALPTLFLLIGYAQYDLTVIGFYLSALFAGAIIRRWSEQVHRLQQVNDQVRRDRYELESFKGELLAANAQAARLAELAERNRISQKLHDDVGHELTAALLALQAFEHLWKENDPHAREMFDQARKRLSNSSYQLRETVHNMKPVRAIGVHRLEEICCGFTAFPVDLLLYGDTSKVPAFMWGILEPCLKEALTNAARHAQARRVEVTIDVSDHIVRLSVFNDGAVGLTGGEGAGLRNLRQRARAVGGNVSTDAAQGYRLVCVLPIRGEDVT